MPLIHELLRARFDVVRNYLDRTLDRFTEEEFNWSPGEGLKTVAEQILEMADKDRESVLWIQTGVWPDDQPATFDPAVTTLRDSRAILAEIRKETLVFLDSMSEEELASPVYCPEAWLESLGLQQCPVSEVLRNIAAHEWYHTGQLIVYRRLLGDIRDDW